MTMQIRKHWSLIIVCMPTKEADSGPIMLHLDSLDLHSSTKLFGIVGRYVISGVTMLRVWF